MAVLFPHFLLLWFGFGFYIVITSSAFCWQEGSVSPDPDLYSDTEESGSESEEATDDDESYEDYEGDECDDATQGSEAYNDDDYVASGTVSESGHSVNNDLDDDKACSSTFLQWHLHFYILFRSFENDGSNKLNKKIWNS